MPQYKIDLHTHSILSHDGGLNIEQYQEVLNTKIDYIAITDHNKIDFALEAHKKIGPKIIIGEEIMTTKGEIIGLFLTKLIEPFQSPEQTIKQIKNQNGLVYIPHPFDKRRSALNKTFLQQNINNIDIIEIFNSRSMLNLINKKALNFANSTKIAQAVGSDSHSAAEIGFTYQTITEVPYSHNLVNLLKNAGYTTKNTKIMHLLNPKCNKLRKLYANLVNFY